MILAQGAKVRLRSIGARDLRACAPFQFTLSITEPLTDPAYEYPHPAWGAAVIGGAVYRGQALNPSFTGRYFFGDSVQFDGIGGDDFEVGTALGAGDYVPLFHLIFIQIKIAFACRTKNHSRSSLSRNCDCIHDSR